MQLVSGDAEKVRTRSNVVHFDTPVEQLPLEQAQSLIVVNDAQFLPVAFSGLILYPKGNAFWKSLAHHLNASVMAPMPELLTLTRFPQTSSGVMLATVVIAKAVF
jgi:hypothetical protein